MLCSQETTVFQLNEKAQNLFQEADCVGLFADHQHTWKALGERGLKGDLFRLGLDSSVGLKISVKVTREGGTVIQIIIGFIPIIF